jgi:hypothetical protein
MMPSAVRDVPTNHLNMHHDFSLNKLLADVVDDVAFVLNQQMLL